MKSFGRIALALIFGAIFVFGGKVSNMFWPASGITILAGIILGLAVKLSKRRGTNRKKQAWDIFLRSAVAAGIAGLIFTCIIYWSGWLPTTPTYNFLSVFLLIAGGPGSYLATIWVRN